MITDLCSGRKPIPSPASTRALASETNRAWFTTIKLALYTIFLKGPKKHPLLRAQIGEVQNPGSL